MRRLYLHVGHLKTGSSWLQASLMQSRERLIEHSISYPSGRKEELALEGKTTSGNGAGLLASPSIFEGRVGAASAGNSHSILFSSEILFREAIHLFDRDQIEPMREAFDRVRRKHGFTEVSCFLFIRNPIGWAASHWQQAIKAGGSADFLEHMEELGRIAPRVEDFLEVARALDMDVTIRNYSNHKSNVLAPICAWLGVPDGTIIPFRNKRVNRSLTHSEVELLRRVNGRSKYPSKDLGFKLVDEAPDVEPNAGKVADAYVDVLYEKFGSRLDKLNEQIEAGERYRVERPSAHDNSARDGSFSFDERQLDVIADLLAHEHDAAVEARSEVERLRKQLWYRDILKAPSRIAGGLRKALRKRALVR